MHGSKALVRVYVTFLGSECAWLSLHSKPAGSGGPQLRDAAPHRAALAVSYVEQLDFKVQRRIRRDLPRALLTVRQLRRHDELARPADAHAVQSLLPAGQHLAAAQWEVERSVPGRGAKA